MNQHEYVAFKDTYAIENGVVISSLDIFLESTTRKVLNFWRGGRGWIVKLMKEEA